jgi:hypothetical protein
VFRIDRKRVTETSRTRPRLAENEAAGQGRSRRSELISLPPAPETRGVNRLREDYATLAGLAELANEWPDTLFVVVHHTRKSDANDGDVMQKISGSQGMTAVTDGNAVLNIRPRNAEESEIVLERDLDTLRWHAIGVDERSQLSASRQTILAWMDTHPSGGQPKTIADDTDLSNDSIRQLLPQMVKDRGHRPPEAGRPVAPVGGAANDLDRTTAGSHAPAPSLRQACAVRAVHLRHRRPWTPGSASTARPTRCPRSPTTPHATCWPPAQGNRTALSPGPPACHRRRSVACAATRAPNGRACVRTGCGHGGQRCGGCVPFSG